MSSRRSVKGIHRPAWLCYGCAASGNIRNMKSHRLQKVFSALVSRRLAHMNVPLIDQNEIDWSKEGAFDFFEFHWPFVDDEARPRG